MSVHPPLLLPVNEIIVERFGRMELARRCHTFTVCSKYLRSPLSLRNYIERKFCRLHSSLWSSADTNWHSWNHKRWDCPCWFRHSRCQMTRPSNVGRLVNDILSKNMKWDSLHWSMRTTAYWDKCRWLSKSPFHRALVAFCLLSTHWARQTIVLRQLCCTPIFSWCIECRTSCSPAWSSFDRAQFRDDSMSHRWVDRRLYSRECHFHRLAALPSPAWHCLLLLIENSIAVDSATSSR